MPRARTTTATDDETVSKKPRTSRSRAVSSDVDDMPAAPRRRRAVAPTPSVESVHAPHHDTGRKAPTTLGERQRQKNRSSRRFFIVAGICFLLFVTGFGIGISDRGVIDVVAVVNERNEKINRGEVRDSNGQLITQTVGVQQPDTRPNGGMIPLEVQPTPTPPTPPPIDMGTSTATTTVATSTDTTVTPDASSTESVVE